MSGNVGEPSVLVLMATFNGAAHVEEQIRTLAAQVGVRVSILLSDDCSSDNTVELARRSAIACRVALTVIQRVQPSGSAARNFFGLLREADMKGYDYVALCDQDDVWLDNKLERACSQLRRLGGDVYSCNSIAFWPDGRSRMIRKDFPQRDLDYLFESASHGCTYVFGAAVACQFADFIESRSMALKPIEFHDWLMYAWARSHGLRWVMDSAHQIRYRQSGHNVIGANAGFPAIVARLRRLREGWLRQQAIAIAECMGIDDCDVVARLRRFAWRDRLILAFNARHYRRRWRDQVIFGLACVTIGI